MTTALAILGRWIERLEAVEKADHWRTQPRVPAGVPEGGQWTDGPYSGSDDSDQTADFALRLRAGRRRLYESVNLGGHPGSLRPSRRRCGISTTWRSMGITPPADTPPRRGGAGRRS